MENVCTDTEKKALVRCTPTENTTNSSHVKWIDLPSMTAARFGHGLVEAGKSHKTTFITDMKANLNCIVSTTQ